MPPLTSDDARDRLSAFWRERWPRHCRVCRGWGCLVVEPAAEDEAGADEAPVRLCTALRPTQCHRCGGLGLPGDAAPCQYCGWEFDDGY